MLIYHFEDDLRYQKSGRPKVVEEINQKRPTLLLSSLLAPNIPILCHSLSLSFLCVAGSSRLAHKTTAKKRGHLLYVPLYRKTASYVCVIEYLVWKPHLGQKLRSTKGLLDNFLTNCYTVNICENKYYKTFCTGSS